MDIPWLYEAIGYLASVLVAVSLMMRSILRLRLINLAGAAFFTLYGLLIRAYPIAAVNFFIVLIDIYFLRQAFTAKEFFTLLEVQPTSAYLRRFLDFYREQIAQFVPTFSFRLSERQLVFFVLRDMVPAGLFIGEILAQNRLLVRLDFVIPGYRDFRIGDFLYRDQAQFFRERGVCYIYSERGNEKHNAYLDRMGFAPVEYEGRAVYCLSLCAAGAGAGA